MKRLRPHLCGRSGNTWGLLGDQKNWRQSFSQSGNSSTGMGFAM
jgi:hypothetical protein